MSRMEVLEQKLAGADKEANEKWREIRKAIKNFTPNNFQTAKEQYKKAQGRAKGLRDEIRNEE